MESYYVLRLPYLSTLSIRISFQKVGQEQQTKPKALIQIHGSPGFWPFGVIGGSKDDQDQSGWPCHKSDFSPAGLWESWTE